MGTFDDILLANVDAELATFGESVVVRPPDQTPVNAADRSCTAIVERDRPTMTDKPRGQTYPFVVKLPKNATTGIAPDEWNPRWEIIVSEFQNGNTKRAVRTTCRVYDDAAYTGWGCQ